MNNSKIFLSPAHLSGKEKEYVNEALESNWIAPAGPHLEKFEIVLANYLKMPDAVALVSATAAIHLALILIGVEAGDYVIAPSFTFSATINPIIYQKAIPILIDSENETWNMDPELLLKAIKNQVAKGKKPKAIIVVHVYGMPAKLTEIIEIAKIYGIPLIEDAAPALGSQYDGQYLGTFGSFGVISFNGNKIITTSGGGVLISNNSEIISKAKFLSVQAKDDAPHYQHSNIGYNYRLSNILAAIGIGQMEVINERIKQRRDINSFYRNKLNKYEGISFLSEPNKKFFSNYWLSAILINSEKLNGITSEQIRLNFKSNGIETRPLFKPMHLQPIFKDSPSYINGFSQKLFENGLCLPSGSSLTDTDRELIIRSFKILIG